MDTIFYNGRINTLDQKRTVAEAVGVARGQVLAVGSNQELKKLSGPKTETVDLKGAVMFPGFMEAHNHLPLYGILLDGLDLSAAQVKKVADILEKVRAAAAQTPAGAWIEGSRYAEYYLAENRHPTRHDLDQVSPKHPVVVYHTSCHACVLNSLGLAAMGITRETPSPPGGIIEKDQATGEPTGVLHDNAMMDVFNKRFFGAIMTMSTAERVALCDRTTKKFASLGLTLASDALAVPPTLEMYQETLAAGRLNTRIYTMNYGILADPLTGSSIKTGFGTDMLRIGPIKLFADGGMSNRTAAVSQPYLTPPYDRGLKIQTREELIERVKWYHALKYQIAIHSQGDEALSDTLDAFEAVLGPKSDNPLRHRIEHAGCLYPALLQRAANMNIGAAVQPVFFSELGDGFIEAFGLETAHKLYPFKSMLAAGLKLGGSSDAPVSELDPRLGLAGAVSRTCPSGQVLGPDEVLTMDQALDMYTKGSAWLSFDEHHNGSIEPGMRADFTVMAEHPGLVAPGEVAKIPFTMTVVDGRVVWSA